MKNAYLKSNPDGSTTVFFPSGFNTTIHIYDRTVVRMTSQDGRSDMSLDLTGFNKLTMDDIEGRGILFGFIFNLRVSIINLRV